MAEFSASRTAICTTASTESHHRVATLPSQFAQTAEEGAIQRRETVPALERAGGGVAWRRTGAETGEVLEIPRRGARRCADTTQTTQTEVR